jgi:hypothetical protein
MKKDNSHKEELEKLSPLLAKLKQEQPELEVPRNYFHNMQVDVLHQLKEELAQQGENSDASPATGNPWYQIFFTPRFALAFSTLLVVGIAVFWFTRESPINQQEVLAMDDISQEEILSYIENNIAAFDADELVEVAPMTATSTDIFQDVELDEEAVDEYLDKIIDDLDDESFENIF